MVNILLAVAIFLSASVLADYPPDQVLILPGLTHQPSFKHYSGYLQVSSTKFLHYWFVTSQNNPSTDPVLLWLNGGPGCSSMEGMLAENGPFQVQDDASLKMNNYSWNRIANVLYLESPAGVGYSYASDGNTSTDDDQTAVLNAVALVQFFKKFPEFSKNEFYISGESYGGVYIPTLAVQVSNISSINFKGIAVGNGLHSDSINDNSLLYFAKYHGLLDQSLWNDLLTSCSCQNAATTLCDFDAAAKDPNCNSKLQQAENGLQNLDVYNLYDPCFGGDSTHTKVPLSNRLGLALLRPSKRGKNLFLRKVMKDYSAPKSRILRRLKTTPPCSNATAMITYLNLPEVRAALHIANNLPPFDVCNENLDYTQIYSDMTSQYQFLSVNTKIRILIYNGDVDMACNFLGAQWFFDNLALQEIASYRQWFYTDADGTKQVGGYGKIYATDNNMHLSLITVRGSGHMVPQDRPIPAFTFIQAFLANQTIF